MVARDVLIRFRDCQQLAFEERPCVEGHRPRRPRLAEAIGHGERRIAREVRHGEVTARRAALHSAPTSPATPSAAGRRAIGTRATPPAGGPPPELAGTT